MPKRFWIWIGFWGIVSGIECFDCTNYPNGEIVCPMAASCFGVGCFFAVNSAETHWAANCSNYISLTERQTSCFKVPNGDEFCVCFSDFCNTPIEIQNAVDLRHPPFTAIPSLPWDMGTTPRPATSSPRRFTLTRVAIPTTLVQSYRISTTPIPKNETVRFTNHTVASTTPPPNGTMLESEEIEGSAEDSGVDEIEKQIREFIEADAGYEDESTDSAFPISYFSIFLTVLFHSFKFAFAHRNL